MTKNLKLIKTFDQWQSQILALEALGIRRVEAKDYNPDDPVNDPQYAHFDEVLLFSDFDWDYSVCNYQRTIGMKTCQEDADLYGLAMEKFHNGEAPFNMFPSPFFGICPKKKELALLEGFRRLMGAQKKQFDGIRGLYRVSYHNLRAINFNARTGKRPSKEEELSRCLWEYERYQDEHPGEKISTPKWLKSFDTTAVIGENTFNDRLRAKKVKTNLKRHDVSGIDKLTDAHCAVLDQLENDSGGKAYVAKVAAACIAANCNGEATAESLKKFLANMKQLENDAQRQKLVEKFVASTVKTLPRGTTTERGPEQKTISAIYGFEKLFKTYDDELLAKIIFGGGDSGTALDSIEERWDKVFGNIKRINKFRKK